MVGNKPWAVRRVGFKRRPLYAPLKVRDLRIASSLVLELTSGLPDGATVDVKNLSGHFWPETMLFQATVEPQRWSPALHVNQVGYLPSAAKTAMVGYYLGDLGELPIPQSEFQLLNKQGKRVYEGRLRLRPDQGFIYSPTPYQQVWEADFSSFRTPGEYRLFVPGLGTSFPFLIDEGVAASFARTFALGIFHQRCGMKEDFPFTRHVHEACHTGLAQVPDLSFAAVNRELGEMSRICSINAP